MHWSQRIFVITFEHFQILKRLTNKGTKNDCNLQPIFVCSIFHSVSFVNKNCYHPFMLTVDLLTKKGRERECASLISFGLITVQYSKHKKGSQCLFSAFKFCFWYAIKFSIKKQVNLSAKERCGGREKRVC